MTLLLLGLVLFTVAHFGTTIAAPLRDPVVARIGEGPWKGIVALVLIGSVWLMVQGYRAAPVDALWVAPTWMRHAVVALMVPTFILYMGSYPGSALRARIRHPQLTGFKLWAVLHLVANGELRAVVLFGGLRGWAVLQMILLNRRDGKPPLPAAHSSVLRAWAAIPIGIVAWVVLLLVHPWLFGVNPLG